MFAGVLVVASVGIAKTLTEATNRIDLPVTLVNWLETDPDAGADAALSVMEDIKASGAFDGVHFVPSADTAIWSLGRNRTGVTSM